MKVAILKSYMGLCFIAAVIIVNYKFQRRVVCVISLPLQQKEFIFTQINGHLYMIGKKVFVCIFSGVLPTLFLKCHFSSESLRVCCRNLGVRSNLTVPSWMGKMKWRLTFQTWQHIKWRSEITLLFYKCHSNYCTFKNVLHDDMTEFI